MIKLGGLYRQYQELKKRFQSLNTAKADPAEIKSTADALAAVESLLQKETEKKKQRKMEKETKEKAQTEVTVEAKPELPMAFPPATDKPGEYDPTRQHKCRGCGAIADGPTWGVAYCDKCWKKWHEDTKKSVEAASEKFALDAEVEPVRGQSGSRGKVMRHDGPGSLVYVRWEEGPLRQREEFGGYYASDLKLKKSAEPVSNPVNEQNLTDYIMRFESGDMEQDDVLALFQYLVDTGMAWSLQGSYGRMAKALIDQGYIKPAKQASGTEGPAGVGYGGDRPGVAVEPKRDESVSLNAPAVEASTDKTAIHINVLRREWEVVPKYDEMLSKFLGYEVYDDLGRKVMSLNTDQQMNKQQLEYALSTELMRGQRTARLVSDLGFLKKGSKVLVLEVKNARVKFASLDGALRGWAPVKKFAASAPQDMKHEDHIDEVLGSTDGAQLVECPKGSGKMRWVPLRDLLPTTQPPATPESLTDMDASTVCAKCGKGISGDPVKSETVKGGKKVFCGQACADSFLKGLNASADTEAARGVPGSVFTSETAPQVLEQIKTSVKAPHVSGYVSTLGGNERVSILLTISLDPKEQWSNGILENSNYGKFHIHNDGTIEQISGHGIRFRKTNAKDVNDLVSKLNRGISQPSVQPKASKRPFCKKEAEQVVTLDQHVQHMRERINSVRERLQTPPTKQAGEQHPLEQPAIEEAFDDLEMGIDLIENIYRDKPDVMQRLEELENILYSVEDQVGIKHDLPEHEKAEPEHAEHVEHAADDVDTTASVEKAADDINSPPTTPPPAGMKYVWDDDKKRWMLIKKQGL